VVLQVMAVGGTLRGASGLVDQNGAAVVIHAGADDDRTDPSGNSGGRIACGVITAAPPG
jgi:Cu-Zn family superoxide dismutase